MENVRTLLSAISLMEDLTKVMKLLLARQWMETVEWGLKLRMLWHFFIGCIFSIQADMYCATAIAHLNYNWNSSVMRLVSYSITVLKRGSLGCKSVDSLAPFFPATQFNCCLEEMAGRCDELWISLLLHSTLSYVPSPNQACFFFHFKKIYRTSNPQSFYKTS